MTKHHRGNEGLLHRMVKEELIYVLEHRREIKKPRVFREREIGALRSENDVVDVVDYSEDGCPRYYEIESKITKRTLEKQQEILKRKGADLIIIDLQKLIREHGEDPGVFTIRRWLKEEYGI